MLYIVLGIFLRSNFSAAQMNPRIQKLYLNKSMPQKIFLSPGLATSVKMPCEIDEVITPGSGILKYISERNKTRFSLEISNQARSTNFIVHCLDSTYVFDLIVNKNLHNDYIEVIGDYGDPRLTQFPDGHSDKSISGTSPNFKGSESEVDGPKKIMSSSVLQQIEMHSSDFDLEKIEKIKIFSSK